MFKKRIIDILHERRENIYRVFFIGKFKFKIFSHKYAIRELQAEIKQLQNEYGSIKLDIQQLSKDISCLRNDIIIYEKEVLENIEANKNVILITTEELQKQFNSISEELCNDTTKQEEIIDAINFQNKIMEKANKQNNDIVISQRESKRELEKLNRFVVDNKNLLKKIEFENQTIHLNAIVHLSAYLKKGNAGDNLLVPALRDSIEKSIDMSINWCHKSVRDMLDDETVQAINNSKGVLIGGGGLFLKDTNENDISGWQWPCSINELEKIRVPIYMLGVGYNRFRNQDDFEPYFKENINEVVRKSEFVGLRNNGSVRAIQSYLSDDLKEKVHFHPCATTVLAKMYRMPKVCIEEPFIAVNCAFDRSDKRYGTCKEEILCSIANVLKKYSQQYKIKYYAHMQSDKEILPFFDMIQLEYEVVDLDKGLVTDDFLRIYSEPALVLAMRGHAQMIPFGCGTPVLSIISHDKLQWFLEDIKHLEWGIDVRGDNFEANLNETMEYMLGHIEQIKKEICFAQDKLWNITQANIRDIFNKERY